MHHQRCEWMVSRGLSKSSTNGVLMSKLQSCQILSTKNNIRVCLPERRAIRHKDSETIASTFPTVTPKSIFALPSSSTTPAPAVPEAQLQQVLQAGEWTQVSYDAWVLQFSASKGFGACQGLVGEEEEGEGGSGADCDAPRGFEP